MLCKCLATELVSRSIKKLAILLDRSVELVIAVLATLKAGAAYIPLDPGLPEGRITTILEDLDDVLLITSTSNLSLFSNVENKSLILNSIDDIENLSHENERASYNKFVEVAPQDPAYILYTSGSTGKPKAVEMSHGPLVNLINGIKRTEPCLQQSHISIQFSSIGFDMSFTDIFLTLSSGGRLILINENNRYEPQYLIDLIIVEGVTLLNLPYAMLQVLSEHCIKNKIVLPSLKCIISTAETLRVTDYIRDFFSAHSTCLLINHYGPSETHVVTTHRLPQNPKVWSEYPSIGVPLPNVNLHILDDNFKLLPPGVIGNLYISGDCLAIGYSGSQDLTAKSFIYLDLDGCKTRVYKTGDLVRYTSSNEIEFFGRSDFQVKIRGFRIELGEIESHIREYNEVKDVVVIKHKDSSGNNEHIVAYIIFQKDDKTDIESIRAGLRERLPDYMCPSYFVSLPEFPLTYNGKLNRNLLPLPESGSIGRPGAEAPIGKDEQRLAYIWKDILEASQIYRNDNFFDLGGHSLLAIKLTSAIYFEFEKEISVNQIFDNSELQQLAKLISEAKKDKFNIIPIADRSKSIPLSFSQQRIWFLNMLEGNKKAYNMPGALRLSGKLNVRILEDTLNFIVNRHDILRTIFTDDESQIILDKIELPFDKIDISNYSIQSKKETIDKIGENIVSTDFELSTGPLLKCQLVKVDTEEYVLFVVMHHIISDGWSTSIFISEIAQLYKGYVNETEALLPDLTIQYADYSSWQRNWLVGDRYSDQIAYWVEELKACPEFINLPTDKPRPVIQSKRGSSLNVSIDSKFLSELKLFSKANDLTLFMVLISAWSILLSRLSGEIDILVGTPVANRSKPELQALIGFFVNTLVVRVDLSDYQSILDFLKQNKKTILRAIENQDVPFESVIEKINPSRSLSHSPIFQTMFSYQNLPDISEIDIFGLDIDGIDLPLTSSKFDLNVSLSESCGELNGVISFSLDLFEQLTIETWWSYYRNILSSIISKPNAAVSTISISKSQENTLSSSELVTEPQVEDKCFHSYFEEQVKIFGKETAVTYNDEEINYECLNEQANKIANYILENYSVGPDSLIGLCVNESIDIVIGILAILKTGAAYLPLDPNNPRDRLEYILSDAEPALVLSHCSLTGIFNYDALVNIDSKQLFANYSIETPPLIPLRNNNLAYVIFTSGTSGKPKGVMIEHASITSYLLAFRDDILKKSTATRWGWNASYAFDGSLKPLCALFSGIPVVLLPQSIKMDTVSFLPYLKSKAIDIVDCTPAQLTLILSDALKRDCSLPRVTFTVGGDRINNKLWNDLISYNKSTGSKAFNVYGPTECTVNCLWTEILPGSEPSLGSAIKNHAVFIVDANSNEIPKGVAGELCVSGPGLARGYLNQTGLSNKKFIYRKLPSGKSVRVYRTGDIVRLNRKGFLEYIGRNDSQVKIRGYRIEPSEIECAIIEHIEVTAAAVVAFDGPNGNKELVAYFRSRVNTLTTVNLKEYISRILPQYMVPPLFVHLEEFPLTINGKIDYKAFPNPKYFYKEIQDYIAPVGELEEALSNIWSDLIGVKKISRDTDFFEIGGHSLLATQVITRIKQDLGYDLKLDEIFRTPKLSSLAKTIETSKSIDLLKIDKASRPEKLPVSWSQQRLWFVSQLEGGNTAYNMAGAFDINGDLNIPVLMESFRHICDRHEILKSCISTVDGTPTTEIIEDNSISVEQYDSSSIVDINADFLKHADLELLTPFNIEQGPLIRGRLVKYTNEYHIIFITMHHLVSDGWSMSIFMNEFSKLYTSKILKMRNICQIFRYNI